MKINIVRRKLIKPCTPTPQNLKNYTISFRDELSPPSNIGFVLFYQSKPQSIDLLKESLSKILPHFYPLAGRYIKQDYTVDCSDQGIEFVEAVAEDENVLAYSGEADDLLPRRSDQFVGPNDPLLSIQITNFIQCRGVAIGVSVSHRIFDAYSITTFVTAWSNANKNPGGEIATVPSFDPHLLFPGKKWSYYDESKPSGDTTVISKRFLFKKGSIMKLRSRLNPTNNVLTKVRIVSALIAKTLIRIDQLKFGCPRPCQIMYAVDIRHRTIPPFQKHSCGNLALHSVAKCTESAADLGIQEITSMISDSIEKIVSDCAKIFCLGKDGYEEYIINPKAELIEGLKSCEVNDMWFSDWSKFGLYEVEFGWGKPLYLGMALVPYERVSVLMSNKDGDGIEAWVHLSANDMLIFEEDEDIKLFTTTTSILSVATKRGSVGKIFHLQSRGRGLSHLKRK